MNKELLKQLKDAGFPFRTTDFGLYQKIPLAYFLDGIDSGIGYIPPSLSELIEACGIGEKYQFRLLAHWDKNDTVWQADLKPFNLGEQEESGLGKTPEEAVARLYLSLH